MEESFYLEKFSIDEFIACLRTVGEHCSLYDVIFYISDVNNYIQNKNRIEKILIAFHQMLKYPIQVYLEFGLLVLRVQIDTDIPLAKREAVYKILSQEFQEKSFLEYAKSKIEYYIGISNDEDITEELKNIIQDIKGNTDKDYVEGRVRLAEEIAYA